jgi:isoleucyl-tRNA synthetase
VHLTDLTKAEESRIDPGLEKSMDYAQRICSLIHSSRKHNKIKVRTPLQKVLVPVIDQSFAESIRTVESIILSEVNVKAIEYIDDTSGLLVKKAKPNFAKLGKQYGPKVKDVSAQINAFSQEDISQIEKAGTLSKGGFEIALDDVVIQSEDVPGWKVASENGLTVALDVHVSEELRREGIARDFVNRVQNLRKDLGLAVLDKINIEVERNGEAIASALTSYKDYISTETQALNLEFKEKVPGAEEIDMDDVMVRVKISVTK